MAGGISFTCANCQALYHVVKAEAGPETTGAEVTCRACRAPFAGREGKFVLKYFMLRHGARAVGIESISLRCVTERDRSSSYFLLGCDEAVAL